MSTYIKLPMRAWLATALLGGVLLSSCGTIDTVGSGAPQAALPTSAATAVPTALPTSAATVVPTIAPTSAVATIPTAVPTVAPTVAPQPTAVPVSDGVLPAPYYFVTNSPAGDSHIVRLERDGTTRTNIVDESPAPAMMILEFDISPVDGSLAYIVQGANGNSLVQTDPTGKHRTVLIADASVHTVRWSPDGKTIAVAVYQAPDTTEGLAGGVYLIPASGGRPTLLQANDPVADPNNPDPAARGYTPSAWSPDSHRLLLGTFSQVVELCGSTVKDLATGALVDIVAPEPLNACGGIWSADGSTIYPNMMRPGYMAPVPGLWRADARTGEMAVHIAGEPQPSQFTLVRGVHGLKDGSAYALLATTNKLPDVAEDANVVWPRFALVHVSSDGATIQPIGSATYENPGDAVAWAANGSGVLLTQIGAKTNNSALVWLPANGGEAVVIANNMGTIGHWGPQ
jgi:hypothetical protein